MTLLLPHGDGEDDLTAFAYEQDGEVGRVELPIAESHSTLFRCSLKQFIPFILVALMYEEHSTPYLIFHFES